MSKKYRCKVCGKKFSSERGLSIHKARVHKKNKKKKILPYIITSILLLAFFFSINCVLRTLERGKNKDHFISINSPLNKTYESGEISINVSSEEDSLWMKSKFKNDPVIFFRGNPVIWNRGKDSLVLHCTKCHGYNLNRLEFGPGIYEYIVV
ncbi:MAG: hypothetical protein GF368_01795, partial [Candidatus Aenigmarchaeota archaeon]|nr:hypothetical protein [Candidatus Aenigmarchaeota archaeon]